MLPFLGSGLMATWLGLSNLRKPMHGEARDASKVATHIYSNHNQTSNSPSQTPLLTHLIPGVFLLYPLCSFISILSVCQCTLREQISCLLVRDYLSMAKVLNARNVPHREPLMLQDQNCTPSTMGYDEFPSSLTLPFSDAMGSLQVYPRILRREKVLIVDFKVHAVEGFGGI